MKTLLQPIQRFFLLTVIGLLFMSGTAFAQSASSISESEIAQKLDEYVAALNKLGPFSCLVLIACINRIEVSKGFGMTNLEYNI